MAAILRTPSLRSPSTVFLCSLTVSDLLVGLPMQPFFTATSFNSGGYLLQSYNMSSSCCGVSLCTMTSISVDRYLALHCQHAISKFDDLKTWRLAYSVIHLVYFPAFVVYLFWGQKRFFLCYYRFDCPLYLNFYIFLHLNLRNCSSASASDSSSTKGCAKFKC